MSMDTASFRAFLEFFEARIADDEAIASGAVRWSHGAAEWADGGEPDFIHIARHDPARVLREVAAKRGIVAKVRQGMVNIRIFPGLWESMQLLAVPYDDHPDYREEWRP
ncbi:hypothetical protein RQCS_40890 [Rhodococcus qingshengii]|nr:hypothetical protein RQCS_40890 [Rhodococcus qingshengii]